MTRTDRLSELCERAYTALDDGDLDAAHRQLGRARRIDSRHPDVRRLEAELAAAEGDHERALRVYEELAAADPEDAEPWLRIAALHFHDRDDPEAALDALDRAMPLVDDEAMLVAGVTLRAEICLAFERPADALEALRELATSAIDEPDALMLVGELHVGAGDLAGALRWFARVPPDDPLHVEALWAMGDAHAERGERDAQVAAWRQVRAADDAAPWPDWHLSHDEFERIAAAALDELPERARTLLADVPVLVDDLPAPGLVDDGVDPRSLGLIVGPNLREQLSVGPAEAVNIFLYQKNLELAFEDPEELAEQIRVTVLHETAHYFGLSEEEVAALGLD